MKVKHLMVKFILPELQHLQIHAEREDLSVKISSDNPDTLPEVNHLIFEIRQRNF